MQTALPVLISAVMCGVFVSCPWYAASPTASRFHSECC